MSQYRLWFDLDWNR